MKPRPLLGLLVAGRCLLPICCAAAAVTLCASPSFAGTTSNITAIWANDGGDKVTRDELRVTNKVENQTGLTLNRTWDGTKVNIFAAHNEVVSFNLVLEAGSDNPATAVKVSFDALTGPNGATIRSTPAGGQNVFDWTNRPIELFYARYLQIRGLSYFGYNKWDERQIPLRMQRPHLDNGNPYGDGGWYDRPDHDKFYPDPLVPLEVVPTFDISARTNQSIWCDIYVSKEMPSGSYIGIVSVMENGQTTHQIPVSLSVYGFALPDQPSAKTMAALSTKDIMDRYISGGQYLNWGSPEGQHAAKITDRYYQLFHRHKVSLIGENECPISDHPCDSSLDRLSGALYSAARGYSGPGIGVPNGVFSIGTYGTWGWQFEGEDSMWRHADAWASWFNQYLPGTDYFLYLQDEPKDPDGTRNDYAKNEMWAKWIREDPGPGNALMSAVTKSPVIARTEMPDVSIPIVPADTGICPFMQYTCDNVSIGMETADYYKSTPTYKYWAYNDGRPATGSSMTEDDGVSMRVIPWTQMKMGIDRWFYWYVNPDGSSNLFQNAVTFGTALYRDYSTGMAGGDGMSNGNGLLVYPGTDVFNPQDSYSLDGPIASLRLKEWRRGLQDADYIALASKINADRTNSIVARVLPKTLHEIVAPEPSYYTGGGPSWSSDPDQWESARAELAEIISSGCIVDSSSSMCSQIVTPGAPADDDSSSLLPLTVSSSTPGATFVIFGSGCPAGSYIAPSTLNVSRGALCMVYMGAPNGFSFLQWSDQVEASNPRWIVMSPQTKMLVANFRISDPARVPVTVTASLPNSSVSVSGNTCPIAGSYLLPVTWAVAPGAQCDVVAHVPDGYRFKQWSNGVNGNPLHLSVPGGAMSLNITYEQITTATQGSPSITISSNPPGASFLSFGSGCASGLYQAPSTIKADLGAACLISIVAPDGMTFSGWSDGALDNPRVFSITSAQPLSYEAMFR